jgi:2'-5' RNA ligase
LSDLSETQRLFFALWPEEEFQVQLARLARQAVGKRHKLVRPGNLHLTLIFMGSMTAQRRACAEVVADGIIGKAFKLRLERIGHWSRSQVVWFAPQETPEPLINLVRQLNQGLVACGHHQIETRPYQAHITLARKVAGHFPTNQVAPLVWQVEYFYLVQSVTYPDGVQYHLLRTWPLAKAN